MNYVLVGEKKKKGAHEGGDQLIFFKKTSDSSWE